MRCPSLYAFVRLVNNPTAEVNNVEYPRSIAGAILIKIDME